MEEKLEPWQEAFVKEKIWPEVLDWYLYNFFSAFTPDEVKYKGWKEPQVYQTLVIVGRPGSLSHSLHVPLSPDHARRVDVLFQLFNINSQGSSFRKLTVRDFFEGTALVVWDVKTYEHVQGNDGRY